MTGALEGGAGGAREGLEQESPNLDDHAPATCALGSALGSKDVGGVGGLLLDLGAFFAGELPPEGQVGGFSRRPSPLNRSAVAAGV